MIPSIKSTMRIEENIDGQISHNLSVEIRLSSKCNPAPFRSNKPLSSPRTDVKISSSSNSNTKGAYSFFPSQTGLHASFMPSDLVFIRRLQKSDLTDDGDDDDDDLVSSDDSSTTRKINRKRRDVLRKIKAKEEKAKEGTTTQHTSEIQNGLSLQRFYVSPFICEGMLIYPHRHEESCVSSIGSCGDDEFSLCNDQSYFELDESENDIKPI